MKPEEMAIRLRTALRYIQSISSNMFFYDAQTGVSFHVANTLEILDKSFPEFTAYERAFIKTVNNAAGSMGVEKFVVLMRNPDADCTNIANYTPLMDMSLVFDEAYKLGLNRALEEAV